jgi:outer membrane lipoprotein carrier protein
MKGETGKRHRKMGKIGGIIALFWYTLGSVISLAHGQDLQEVVRAIDEQQQKIQTLAASFSQKRETSLAKDPLFSLGIVRFKRPDRVHFIYSQPESMEVALDGKTVWIFYPGQSQAEKYSLSRNKKMSQLLEPVMGIFRKTLGQLTEEYTITYMDGGEERTYWFRLHPREVAVRKFLRSVDLWIDKASGAILRFEMVETSRDRLTLEFKDLKINPPLTDEELAIRIPPTVRVQEQAAP